MATTPRLTSAVPDQEASFGTVMSHAPEMLGRFGALYAELWQNGSLPADLREMTRLRNARVTDCGY